MITPTVRLATEADLPAINAIYNHYVRTSTTTYQETEDTLQDRLTWFRARDQRHVVTVALIDGVVVGWASLNVFRARSAYRFTCENSVYVAHDQFRRGIGSTLLADSIERAKVHGFRAVVAGIDADQSASVALHARHGFVIVGRFPGIGFKFDRWLDVIFMQLSL